MSSITSVLSAAKTNLLKLREKGETLSKAKVDQPCWPHPEHSVGEFLDKISGKKYWDTKGPRCPVNKSFMALLPDLSAYLEAHTEPTPTIVFWTVYMVGTKPSNTVPTIVVCCEDETYRKAVVAAIRESGILEEYPGFSTSHLPEPLMSDGPLALMASDTAQTNPYITTDSEFQNLHVYGYDADLRPGRSTRVQTKGSKRVETATIGGAVKILGQLYYMTAAHPFVDGAVSRPLIQRFSITRAHRKDFGLLRYTSLDGPSTTAQLDYALFKPAAGIPCHSTSDLIHECAFPLHVTETRMKLESDVRVYAAVSKGSSVKRLYGRRTATPGLIRGPYAKHFQRVYPVQFNSPVAQGISGSWVIGDTDGYLHGHVIAGSPGGRTVYIVPAHEVYKDMQRVASSWAQELGNNGIEAPLSIGNLGVERLTTTVSTPFVGWYLYPAGLQMPPDGPSPELKRLYPSPESLYAPSESQPMLHFPGKSGTPPTYPMNALCEPYKPDK